MIHHASTWKALRMGLLGAAIGLAALLPAQNPEPVEGSELPPPITQAMDDFTERNVVAEKTPIPYARVREADIFWEKRIWRVIDTREKINQPFVAPESALFNVITEAALNYDLVVYEDEKFSKKLSTSTMHDLLNKRDTISIIDPVTYEDRIQVVENSINWEDIKRFRIKEAWFFDENTSTLKVRILGIAPLREVRNNDGDFMYEIPLFWVHYPSARDVLARNKCITHQGNMAAATTWEDLFEMRLFAALPVKENNVKDLRLQDYLSGIDIVHEAKNIDSQMFNMEHDLWTW